MNSLEIVNAKIFTKESIRGKLGQLHFFGKKIVFTNGVFDLLHLGHIDYLAKASDCGDFFIVGVNSDASVKMLNKGNSRPLQDERSRSMIIASLQFVDAVILFEEETPYELIKYIQPDVLVKGADYKVEQIAGHDIVLAKGGEVKLIEIVQGYSTTNIEKKIRGEK
ncbi:MAG TPA: D-glycero-beta-D-manno-heptose 1-phosphate adenylyltransferase [Bacteroidia bacterium]|jgi:rfaE bifunctional protein nucleotidyltransferase chain/domain|nr:D-glycero-beta-D-manno-heptose 1-phosphate adenylyltransferase [Bacteroidia bacterium]